MSRTFESDGQYTRVFCPLAHAKGLGAFRYGEDFSTFKADIHLGEAWKRAQDLVLPLTHHLGFARMKLVKGRWVLSRCNVVSPSSVCGNEKVFDAGHPH